MIELNRLFWMVLFLVGTSIFALIELRSSSGSQMLFFILTSLWSALCAIAYTILHWFLARQTNNVDG